MKAPVQPTNNGISISLYVQPCASRTEWSDLMNESIKLRLAARPIDGEANEELRRFLAKFFHVAKSSIALTRGATGRRKTVTISGDTDALMELAKALLAI